MKDGQSQQRGQREYTFVRFGQRVKIKDIRDAEDMNLNGKTGVLCRKHRFEGTREELVFGQVGIILDDEPPGRRFANLMHGEYEPIEKHEA